MKRILYTITALVIASPLCAAQADPQIPSDLTTVVGPSSHTGADDHMPGAVRPAPTLKPNTTPVVPITNPIPSSPGVNTNGTRTNNGIDRDTNEQVNSNADTEADTEDTENADTNIPSQ